MGDVCASAVALSVPEYLSDYSLRGKLWDVHKAQADAVAALYAKAAEFELLAARIYRCAGYLGFTWLSDPEAGEAWLKLCEAHFCHGRHCPVCQWRRSLMWKARFLQALPRLLEVYPKARWVFLTLTVRNVLLEDLRRTLQAMNAGWNRLRLRREFRSVIGWIRTTEVTRGQDGTAHPHFHVLLMVPSSYFGRDYVTQAHWTELWRDCARLSYQPIVDVRVVKGNLTSATAEVLKYAVKPGDLEADPEWLHELTRQLHKRRFVAAGGVLKNVLKPEEEITDADLVTGEDSSGGAVDPDLFFGWVRPKKRYRRSPDRGSGLGG